MRITGSFRETYLKKSKHPKLSEEIGDRQKKLTAKRLDKNKPLLATISLLLQTLSQVKFNLKKEK